MGFLTGLLYFLMLIGFLAMIGFLMVLAVQAIRKKKIKWIIISVWISFAFFLSSCIGSFSLFMADKDPPPTIIHTSAPTTLAGTPTPTPVPAPTPVPTDRGEYLTNEILRITYAKMTGPNSAGGVSFDIDVKNMSPKEIKYVRIKIGVVNRVGDLLNSEIEFDNEPLFWLEMVGPIAQNKAGGKGEYWESALYNSTASGWGIYQIVIDYTDGSSMTLDQNDVQLISH